MSHAPALSPAQRFRQAVRRIAVYSADEGTQGWLLTEAQFDAIGAAFDECSAALLEES